MYKVSKSIDPKYGNVIIIERTENEGIESPFLAMQDALKKRRLWKEISQSKIRLLVCGQIMTSTQADIWQKEESASLPKCAWCARYLVGELYNHRLSGTALFCSQACADQGFSEELEKLKDEEEFELL